MEILLALVVVVIVALLIFKNSAVKGLEVLDVNKDGKVDLADAKAAVEKTVAVVETAADVNKDGKVDLADVKAAVTKTKAAAKKAAVKAKTVVKAAVKKANPRGSRPKA